MPFVYSARKTRFFKGLTVPFVPFLNGTVGATDGDVSAQESSIYKLFARNFSPFHSFKPCNHGSESTFPQTDWMRANLVFMDQSFHTSEQLSTEFTELRVGLAAIPTANGNFRSRHGYI